MALHTQLERKGRNIRPIGGWDFEVVNGIFDVLEVEGIEKPGSIYDHTFSQDYKVVDANDKLLLRIKKGDVYTHWVN